MKIQPASPLQGPQIVAFDCTHIGFNTDGTVCITTIPLDAGDTPLGLPSVRRIDFATAAVAMGLTAAQLKAKLGQLVQNTIGQPGTVV